MADDKVTTKASDELQIVPPLQQARPLALVQAVPWFIVIALLALAAFLGWKAFFEDDLGDPVSTSIVAFEKQNRLTVFSAELSPVVSAEDSRLFGLVNSRQVAVIPARVDYTLELGKIDRNRLAWSADTRTLAVQLPQIVVGKPNLDEARAQYLREGIWISRAAQDKLSRNNTRLAEQQAVRQAANPVLMNLARDAAREAVKQNLTIPLEVAGYGNVTVDVRFDGEAARPTPGG